MITLVIVWFLVVHSYSQIIPRNFNLKITSLEKCSSSATYALEVHNVIVNIDGGKIVVTGTLTTVVDLTPPITAKLKVEKHVLYSWLPVLCINSVGSCTYDDLCEYGIPSNISCPQLFLNNNIPCRCPISKGNYTIPSSLEFNNIVEANYFSIYSGSYWARVTLMHNKINLACYELYFDIIDRSLSKQTEINYNDQLDKPFVTLIVV